MKIITNHPVITEANPFSPENDYWSIDGSNDLQVRHFQVWANTKKSAGLRLNGRLDRKTKNAYAAFGTEWDKEYKKAYPNLSTTNPQGLKKEGKLWDSTKNVWITARDSGLLQQGLDALGLNYQLPTGPPAADLNAGSGPSRTDAAVDAVDDLETEIKKEKNKKLIKQAAITALCLVVVFVLYKKLAK